MNEHIYQPPQDQGDGYTSVEERLKQAAREAAKQTSPKPSAPEDLGIHRTQEDIWERELKAAGWKPMAAHPRSPIWKSPDGVVMPGPGYAHSVMKQSITPSKEQQP